MFLSILLSISSFLGLSEAHHASNGERFSDNRILLHKEVSAAAVTAPDTVLILQSDRSKLHVICDGNLIIGYCETLDGYTLVLDPIGMYEYAARGRKGDLIPMGLPAKDEAERSPSDIRKLKHIPKHLRYSGKKLAELEAKQKKANEDPAIIRRDKKHQ